MKSERMKTSGMGWGAGFKESEIVLVFMRRRGLESRMENSVLFACFCLSPGKNNKERRKMGIQSRRDVTVIL